METVIKREGFSDAQQAVLHNDGPETEIGYRLAWARTYLKGMGLLTNSSRGVWALTDDGTGLLTDPSATDDQRSERIQELRARYLTEMRTARKARLPQDDGEPDDVQSPTDRSWKEQLLEQLMSMAPDAFERLARRLLREADFDSVNVTGQSGDGGIDGLGVYRLGLVSFPVLHTVTRVRVGSCLITRWSPHIDPTIYHHGAGRPALCDLQRRLWARSTTTSPSHVCPTRRT